MPVPLIAAGAVCLLLVARAAASHSHPMLRLLSSAVCGAAGLAALALLEPVTGVMLPFNAFTGGCAAVLGLPGVILLLILNVLL